MIKYKNYLKNILEFILLVFFHFSIVHAGMVQHSEIELPEHFKYMDDISLSGNGKIAIIKGKSGQSASLLRYEDGIFTRLSLPKEAIHIDPPKLSFDGKTGFGLYRYKQQEPSKIFGALYLYNEGKILPIELPEGYQDILDLNLSFDDKTAYGTAVTLQNKWIPYIYKDSNEWKFLETARMNDLFLSQYSQNGVFGFGIGKTLENEQIICVYENGHIASCFPMTDDIFLGFPKLSADGKIGLGILKRPLFAEGKWKKVYGLYHYENNQIQFLKIPEKVKWISAPVVIPDGAIALGRLGIHKHPALYLVENKKVRIVKIPDEYIRISNPQYILDGRAAVVLAFKSEDSADVSIYKDGFLSHAAHDVQPLSYDTRTVATPESDFFIYSIVEKKLHIHVIDLKKS